MLVKGCTPLSSESVLPTISSWRTAVTSTLIRVRVLILITVRVLIFITVRVLIFITVMNARITLTNARIIGINFISLVIVVVMMVNLPYNSFWFLLYCNLLDWLWFWDSYNNPLNSNTFSLYKPSPKLNPVSEFCLVHLKAFS